MRKNRNQDRWSPMQIFTSTLRQVLILALMGMATIELQACSSGLITNGIDGHVDGGNDAGEGGKPDSGVDDGGNDAGDEDDPIIPAGIPIPKSSAIEDSAKDRIVITFDRNLAKTSDEGFVIRGADNLTVTGTSIQGHVLTLYLSADAEYLQNAITWSYDDASGGIRNLRELRLVHVTNHIAEPPVTGTEYFVSTTGSSDNDGLSEDSPWTIEHAVAKVTPGDKVWIKAGNYGNKRIVFSTSGTATERICFEGYKTSTGGIPDRITSLYYDYTPDGVLDAAELPLFDGGDETGFAFSIVGLTHLTFRNLSFTNYQMALFGGWEPAIGSSDPSRAVKYCLFERIAVTNVGGGTNGGAFIELGEKDYNEYITVKDCNGQNSSMVGFFITGKGNLISNSHAYCDRDNSTGGEAQDYYFAIKGIENVSIGNLAHKVIQVEHGGHGYALRGESPSLTQYNLVQDCTAINIAGAFELRNETNAYNVVRDCVSKVDGAIDGESTGGIEYFGGAHHNLVEGFSAQGVSVGISFQKNSESITTSCGHDNIIRNSEFYGMPEYDGSHGYSLKHAILGSASFLDQNNPEFTNNTFINCTFHDFSYFLRLYPDTGDHGVTASGNKIINCSISKGLYFKHPDTIAEAGFSFSHCNIFEADTSDGGFATIIGTDQNVSLDPLYRSEAQFDFHLQEGSGNIDRAINSPDVLFDFDGNERPQAGQNDIGAYER